MKFRASNVSLVVGFFTITILPAILSHLLGGDSIRAGLCMAIAIYFVIASPFRIRYFITSRIILVNSCVLIMLSLLYLFPMAIFGEMDNLRFLLSLVLICLISICSSFFVATLDSMSEALFHKTVMSAFYFLACLGYIILIQMLFFGKEGKGMLLFSEPSHYAIVYLPFAFYAAYTSSSRARALLYLSSSLILAFLIQNLTLLVGCLIIAVAVYGRRYFLLGFIGSVLAVLGYLFLDLQYFLGRLDFSADNNLSSLVFLSGWEQAYLGFFSSYGFGIGFQQMGLVGPVGNFQVLIQTIITSGGIDVTGGGTLGAKVLAELGFFGILALLTYIYFGLKVLVKLRLRRVGGVKNIFFLGVFLLFSIELFIRGMGYFSLTSFLFISSCYWFHRSRIFAADISLTKKLMSN